MAYTAFPDVVGIAAGTLDNANSEHVNGQGNGNEGEINGAEKGKGEIPGPGLHIFLKEKADWFEVPQDGLDRFEQFP